jgi:hypothetical protein
MNNSNMRFKDFIWPINPSEISFSTKNIVKELNLLYGGCILQNLGRQPKIIKGKGTFTGENAFEHFGELEKLLEDKTSGVLLISGVAPCFAMLSQLNMLQCLQVRQAWLACWQLLTLRMRILLICRNP